MGRVCNYGPQVRFGFFHLLSQLEILGYAFFVGDFNGFQTLFGYRQLCNRKVKIGSSYD